MLLQVPMGAEDQFDGVIDLIDMKQIRWDDENLGATYVVDEIPSEYADLAMEYREKLLESVSEEDDAIMEKYLGEEEITRADLIAAVRKATINRKLVPVLCGSALKNKGIQPLLNAIAHFFPAPWMCPRCGAYILKPVIPLIFPGKKWSPGRSDF